MNAAVIIPAYEPDEGLIEIVNRVWELENQVIVVNDGSGKSFNPIFEQVSEKSIILEHEENMGKGQAIKTALLYISENLWDCDVIGIMDADGQHLPEDMERLMMKANLNPNALILGTRKVGKEMPLRSRLGNEITRVIFHLSSGVRVSDTQTGLRAFSRKMIEEFMEVEGNRYEYETNVLFYCAKKKIQMLEVPIKTIYRDAENSTSHFHAVKDSIRIYKHILKFSLSSISSFFVDYGLFCLFVFLFPKQAWGIALANVTARILSGIYNYIVNCRLVFQTDTKVKSAVQYIVLAICIILLNSVVLQIYIGMIHIPVYRAKILTECTLFIVSFLVQRYMIFPEKFGKKGMIDA